ncbi:hypothetical protein [Polaribacter ponticola]|uniref:Uncharacterized protein n=1 Tax=Polaribacter ponticola TaxID=2978475 RepID=A0ABT5S6U7_9FLAO|nr:hypothetical protein [Polaribacter sp. MSW5]MDD7913821.1 hypothetical protein [Polaribacter sp. MSW5]
MKKTLEYKILKYLFENDNNEFVKIVGIEKDSVLLNEKIVELKELNLIEYELVSDKPKFDNNGEPFKNFFTKNPYLCKITFKGKKELYKTEKEIIDFELAEKTLGKFKRTQIISILGLIISGSLLILKLIEWSGILQSTSCKY